MDKARSKCGRTKNPINMTAMDSKSDVERRQDKRYVAAFDVRFARAAQAAQALRAFSINFSARGLCLRTKEPHAKGEILKLDLTVEGVVYRLEAEVAWVRGDAMGVRFVNVDPAMKAGLEAVARSLEGFAPEAT